MTDAKKDSAATKRANTPGPTELALRPATGRPRAQVQSHEELYDFVTVDSLKRDYTFGPAGNQRTYGPSSVPIDIPDALAEALGLAGKRKSHALTREEEKDSGADKPEKHPTAAGMQKNQNFNTIPVSDPAHEAPGQEERDAAHEALGITTEQIVERHEAEKPPRERDVSKPATKK